MLQSHSHVSCLKNILNCLVLAQLLLRCSSYKICPSEYSPIEGTSIRATWTSNPSVKNQLVTSVPPCQDIENRIITRTCTNGAWYPPNPPRCLKISENMSWYTCPSGCLITNENNSCYCKSRFCPNLATASTTEQKNLVQKVAGNEMCQLGSSSNPSLNFYVNGTNFLYGNYATKCFICAHPVLSFDPKLVLSFEERKRRLYLSVYSPEGLFHNKKEELFVFCFTNAAVINLKEKSKTELIFKKPRNVNHFSESLAVFKVKLEKYVAEYWCLARYYNLTILESNKVIAFEKKGGYEYALRIVFKNVCKYYLCKVVPFFQQTRERMKEILERLNPEIRFMEVFDFNFQLDDLDVLIHISTGKNLSPLLEYEFALKKLENITDASIKYFRSSEFCFPEKTIIDDIELHWPLTKLNNVVISEEFCLMANGTPVARLCRGSFLYGARWSGIRGHCQNANISSLTTTLRELSKSNTISGRDLWGTVKNATNLSVVDIYYLGVILGKLSANESIYALDVINKLMTIDKATLRTSQKMLNLTDIALEIIEEILTNVTFVPESPFCIKKENLIVHISNPFLSNTSGVALYDGQNSSEISVVDVAQNDTLDSINTESLLLAVYFPDAFLEHVLNETESNVSDIVVVTVIFYQDSLFVDNRYESGSFVVSVSIPGYGSYLKTPIPIIFRSRNVTESRVCGFWDQGKKTNWKKGEWSVLGSDYERKLQEDDLHVCSFIHLTHFALLIMSDKKDLTDDDDQIVPDLEKENEHIFEILTVIGFSFSLFGIFGIFLTAIIFKKWRNKIGTKILLHSCVAILLEIICIHLSEIRNLKTSETICRVIGMVLHYVVLCKFCWTSIYAFLQYYRFVKVIGVIPKNLMLKSAIAGWGGPLILVFTVAMIPEQTYVSQSYELCYPRGLLFYLSVLTPVCVITIANIAVFCVIMYNVAKAEKSSNNDHIKLFKLKLYLALLLFSALGISWIFGILGEIWYDSAVKVILYIIFCITATMQGFVLFLFYVVLNKETRDYWSKYIQLKLT